MDEVLAYLKANPTYFLATVDEAGNPQVRPFGTIAKFEGKLYIQTGRVKPVSEQMLAHPRVAICASGTDGTWLRITADAVLDDRLEAREAVLAEYPDCQIVLDDTANWNRDEAMELVENWLAGGTQIDAIICHNDIMAMGALQACQDSNLDIPIIGIDATYDALCAVKDGTLAADVYQDVYGQAEEAFNVCVRILNGTDYEKTTYVPFQLITQENVDEYLENF